MNVYLRDDFATILRALVTHALEPMTVIDSSGVIAFENEAIERQTGYPVEERIGRPIFDFVHLEDRPHVREAFERARTGLAPTPLLDFRVRHRDGRWLPVEAVVRFIGGGDREPHGLIHSRDVGERHDLRTRLRHARRLTRLGRLTVSMAEEFANIVATIRVHLRTLEESDVSRAVPFAVRAIMRTTETAATLARQLRGFGEVTPIFPHSVDVHQLLSELHRELGDRLWLEVQLKAQRPIVRTDRASLRQGLTDLLWGFRHAMPDRSVVAIATYSVSVPPSPDAQTDFSIDYLVITVTNTGRNPAEEHGLHLFEASAVTPASGSILLALLVLHDVVSDAGGFIEVASTKAGATAVHIYHPVTSDL
jgi:PAS domain S-box-containing protein